MKPARPKSFVRTCNGDVAVTGRFEGVSLGEGMELVQQAVTDLHVPTSIRVVYGGIYEEQQKSFSDFCVVLALAVVLVFTVLLFEFRTFAAPGCDSRVGAAFHLAACFSRCW